MPRATTLHLQVIHWRLKHRAGGRIKAIRLEWLIIASVRSTICAGRAKKLSPLLWAPKELSLAGTLEIRGQIWSKPAKGGEFSRVSSRRRPKGNLIGPTREMKLRSEDEICLMSWQTECRSGFGFGFGAGFELRFGFARIEIGSVRCGAEICGRLEPLASPPAPNRIYERKIVNWGE